MLVSGNGTNLQSIIDACAKGLIDGRVEVVISNRDDAYALERAQKAGIYTRVVKKQGFADRSSFDAAIAKVFDDREVDLVVLAGFMRILGGEFIRAFKDRIMNIHPALLPSFPGLDVRQKAIDRGVRFSGATVHFVDEGLDTGPIIIQAVCPVYTDDTEEILKHRILRLEHRIYPRAIDLFARGRLEIKGSRVIVHGVQRDEDAWMMNPQG